MDANKIRYGDDLIEGTERGCKILKVKSHESILEQSKKYVIRDRILAERLALTRARVDRRARSHASFRNRKGTRQRKTEERT